MAERRTSAPQTLPVGVTIAGSDAGGGAGVQADMHAMAASGVFPTNVITAVTAQNTRGVESVHVLPLEEIEAQYNAIASDFEVGAIKTGMLATASVIRWVAETLADYPGPVVIDPVMVAASGDRLLEPDGEDAYTELIEQASVVTPNRAEAEVLTGTRVEDRASAERAGEQLRALGARAALVKGGHGEKPTVEDVLVTGDGTTVFEHPRIDTAATHGSGCVLASTIAANLANDRPLQDAIEQASHFMERAVRYHLDVGAGAGPVNPHAEIRTQAAQQDTAEAVTTAVEAFVDRDVSAVVPEVGMNVVGATPYSEAVSEIAAVEGRITRTLSGVAPNRGVRFGASSHVARFLLGAREFDPTLRYAVNLRYSEAVLGALEHLQGPIAEYDRRDQPPETSQRDGETMRWAAERAFAGISDTPVAVTDAGAHGKEPMVKLLARDVETLIDRTFTITDVLP